MEWMVSSLPHKYTGFLLLYIGDPRDCLCSNSTHCTRNCTSTACQGGIVCISGDGVLVEVLWSLLLWEL
ncbi:hypothetical protein P8452_08611 [Trifolium repens]|nr:hypothetical protein P8452_08611 [Trifolium repens]